jgi:dTDP-4-amino-4,6-dideoxygalactose transaminase
METKFLHIPYSRAWITADDLIGIQKVLSGGKVSQGSVTREFEETFSKSVCASDGDGIGFASGMAALTAALWALEIGQGDEVIVPSYICREVIDAVLGSGATPVFADVGRQWVMTVENVITQIHPCTRAIIVPHLFGIFADITSFLSLGIPVIEDCAQAFGSSPEWQITGDIATFSFRWSKCLTTGEGGMAVTRNRTLWKRLQIVRDGGETPRRRIGAPLSDMASALGLSQLKRYPVFLDRRRIFALQYKKCLDAINPSLLEDVPYHCSMFYRLPIKVQQGWHIHHQAFLEKGIEVDPGIPMLQHRNFNLTDNNYSTSLELLARTIVLPIYPNISQSEMDYCTDAVTEVLRSILRC